jgi:hypothetical protein
MLSLFQKRIFIANSIILSFTLHSCSSPDTTPENSSDIFSSIKNEVSYHKVEYPMIDVESVQIDSLYIQVAYEINPERWILIAESVNDLPEGLRLMLINPKKKNQLIYQSKGAYESIILHPQFFIPDNAESPWVILCAIGQMESWGQEFFLMKGDQINEIAYLDVAKKEEADTLFYETGYKLSDIGEFTVVHMDSLGIHFNFKTDSLIYFGSLGNKMDPILSGTALSYTYSNGMLKLNWPN